ncbi:MAG: diadenylate cyclase CdaA [Lentisphaeria bacterium]|nr:diadenylate cyclase CdaA [Lentisphaeria bacterium]
MMTQIWEILLNWRQPLEIVIIFAVVYTVLYYSRKTHGARMMLVLVVLLLTMWVLARIMALPVITMLFEEFYGSTIIALLIIFQPEVRRGLTQLGLVMEKRHRKEVISEIEDAVINMAGSKIGALIVIEGKEQLRSIIDDAIQLDAQVNSQLLESIFFPNSPLHDGAVIIRGDRIVAARAILPLTRSKKISPHLGTRHRAAMGIAEESDAVTIMISEESGGVCVAYDGELHRDLSEFGLSRMLETLVVGKNSGDLNETLQLVSAEEESASLDGNGRKEEK